MRARINLITIWTDDIARMKEFYEMVIGFTILNDLDSYVEFYNDGVRFAICLRSVMSSHGSEFTKQKVGQSFELAFECNDINDVNRTYEYLINNDAKSIAEPRKTPWGQYTALFADPDGNIHEIFCDI